MQLIISVSLILQILSRSFKSCPIRVICGRGQNMNPLTVTFISKSSLLSVWWDMMPSILNGPCDNRHDWHATYSDLSYLWFGRDWNKRSYHGKILPQVCSKNEREYERIILNERSTKEIKSESTHQSVNTSKEKYGMDEIEDEDPSAKNNPVINETSYFNPFECGKNLFSKIDAMYEQSCMKTLRDKYYTDIFNTITYYNEHKKNYYLTWRFDD